ncbi:hypothetical protein [uncultured Mediterranean phage uvMED]|nr:hypothetical protein [uncultured Mediterranean phage uvMED]BAQ90922.1 hypothetical protein [uncultured Mediterranean phage uvMED]|tara:strand:+ start:447 stop:707 length:261 start_codon:yes stop_codon:yes gene_type:complete
MSLEDKKLFCISEDQIAEMEDGLDLDKMRAFDKHNSDIETMTLCKAGLNMYIKRFGKESNIYEKCKELIVELDNNIKHTQNYMDVL